MKSKFSEFFDRVRETKSNHGFTLTGNRLLVEILPEEEIKTKSGLVIASDLSGYKTTTQNNRPTMALVLYVGTHTYDLANGGMTEGSTYKPGQVIWITKHPHFISEFPGLGSTEQKLAFMTDDPNDVHAVWPDMAAYEAFKKAVQVG